MSASHNHHQAKAMYMQGKGMSGIAALLGVSRTTIYSYKAKDKKNGMDWNELRFLKATDASDAQAKEEQFVALLIFQFEQALDGLDDVEAEKKISIISKHIDTYYKLKKQQGNVKVSKADVAKTVLHQISGIALEKEASTVVRFLADHADQIVSAVVK